jgi:hypothetical protein
MEGQRREVKGKSFGKSQKREVAREKGRVCTSFRREAEGCGKEGKGLCHLLELGRVVGERGRARLSCRSLKMVVGERERSDVIYRGLGRVVGESGRVYVGAGRQGGP